MGGQKFQYDESGATFFYFLLSFLVLILIPATFYFWPKKQKQDPDKERKKCQCFGCLRKWQLLHTAEPYKQVKSFLTKLTIVSGWVLLALLAYKVSQFDYEMANFDPYEVLGVSPSASTREIKSAYRKLSLILHPDKETGNEKAFMKLTKAYQALTEEEARKNWEKYGNPDGPGAMSFGIALPSWIVEKENSVWVLGLYALVFMIALPLIVGIWWYRSIKYSGDKVLLLTTNLYYHFFYLTPNMALKRVIMILAASLEFEKASNSEIIERQSDNEEVPALIRQLPKLGEKNKERPFCHSYSIKARALLHAHLTRMELNRETLDKDRLYIVGKAPYLIQEQVSCVTQLALLAYSRRIYQLPTIETLENCMRLSPMIVQALWEFKSPLLQLPHITEDRLKFFYIRKKQVRTLQQFAQLKNDERRNIVKFLSDQEYENVMKVLGKMPYIDFSVKTEVIDDENSAIVTAGAIVTVTVTLVRKDMSSLFGDSSFHEDTSCIQSFEEGVEGDTDNKTEEKTDEKEPANGPKKPPAWLKPKKSTGKKKDKKHGRSQKQQQQSSRSKAQDHQENHAKERSNHHHHHQHSQQNNSASKEKKDDSEDGSSEASDSEDPGQQHQQHQQQSQGDDIDEDREWDRIQKRLHSKEKQLEGRSKSSHSVHCPYFPHDKQEYWWAYVCDRKSHTLLTAPLHITNLTEMEEYQLKFTAPTWTGVFVLNVCLRSDSYLGFDQMKEIRLDVKAAPAVPKEHPQWEFDDSADERKSEGSGDESDYTTDEDVPEDDR